MSEQFRPSTPISSFGVNPPHRRLARAFADELGRHGMRIAVPPALDCVGQTPSKWADAVWMVREGVPWLGRRAGDLTPWAARMALTQLRPAANAEVQRLRA
jgi:hypothetical protein